MLRHFRSNPGVDRLFWRILISCLLSYIGSTRQDHHKKISGLDHRRKITETWANCLSFQDLCLLNRYLLKLYYVEVFHTKFKLKISSLKVAVALRTYLAMARTKFSLPLSPGLLTIAEAFAQGPHLLNSMTYYSHTATLQPTIYSSAKTRLVSWKNDVIRLKYKETKKWRKNCPEICLFCCTVSLSEGFEVRFWLSFHFNDLNA